jgi:hypothetical protein
MLSFSIIHHNSQSSGHYPSSCLLLKIRRFEDGILSPLQVERTQLVPIDILIPWPFKPYQYRSRRPESYQLQSTWLK